MIGEKQERSTNVSRLKHFFAFHYHSNGFIIMEKHVQN